MHDKLWGYTKITEVSYTVYSKKKIEQPFTTQSIKLCFDLPTTKIITFVAEKCKSLNNNFLAYTWNIFDQDKI